MKKIKAQIKKWLEKILETETISNDIFTLNFGLQKTAFAYEAFISGHQSYFDEHDTWLLDITYEPDNNFISLGKDSLKYSEKEMFEIYKKIVTDFLKTNISRFPSQIKYYTCEYPFGEPELIMKNEK